MKKCSKCGEYKEFSEFHKSKSSKDGYKSWCKECRKQETLEYRVKNRDKLLENKKKWYRDTKELKREERNQNEKEKMVKTCSKCNEVKNIEHFRQRANGGYYSICKVCENIKNKEYRKNNPETINKLRVIHENRRRSIKNNLSNNFTTKQWKECKDYFNNSCAYCGREMKNLTQDHFIPVSKGGTYSKENIIPACRSCNCKKHNKNFYEWYKSYEHYSLSRLNKIETYLKDL